MANAQVGFTAKFHEAAPLAPSLYQIYSFDSGAGLTLDDLSHNLVVFGTTGSGKTHSVALPIFRGLLAHQLPGLLIDSKGNLRKHLRHLAKEAGAIGRIKEYGTGPDATPINIFAGRKRDEIRMMLEDMEKKSFDSQSHNLDFHLKGIAQAADCITLLIFIGEKNPEVEANLVTMIEMINSERRSQELYKYFKDHVFDPQNDEHVEFAESVEGNRFHILFRPLDLDENETDSTRQEQMNYALGGVRTAFRRFLDTANIAEKFCAHGAPGLDIKEDLRNGRIILLRFDPSTGRVGEDLARYFITEYYKAIYEIGLELPHKTFLLVDEYQEVALLDNSRYADNRFVAMSRELGSICIFLTQSLAALGGSGKHAEVNSLIANCNCRIMFYNDDPLTQEMAHRYANIDLASLEPQHAFVVRYDAQQRRHTHNIETMNEAFAETQLALAEGAKISDEVTGEAANTPRKKLHELLKLLNAKTEKSRAARLQAARRKGARETASASSLADKQNFADGNESEKEATMENVEDIFAYGGMREIFSTYPNYFDHGSLKHIDIPVGWRPLLVSALEVIKSADLHIKICKASHSHHGGCQIRCSDDAPLAMALINRVMEKAEHLCPICGSDASGGFLCADCQKEHNIFETTEEPEEEDLEDFFTSPEI